MNIQYTHKSKKVLNHSLGIVTFSQVGTCTWWKKCEYSTKYNKDSQRIQLISGLINFVNKIYQIYHFIINTFSFLPMQKMNAEAILCTENCPSIRFFGRIQGAIICF